MSDYFCSKCGKWKNNTSSAGKHKCPPAWMCWAPNWLGHEAADAETIYEGAAGWAAEKYVERKEDEGAEYYVADGESVQVFVMLKSVFEVRLDRDEDWTPDLADPALYVFEVTGEVTIDYHAKEQDKGELEEDGQD